MRDSQLCFVDSDSDIFVIIVDKTTLTTHCVECSHMLNITSNDNYPSHIAPNVD